MAALEDFLQWAKKLRHWRILKIIGVFAFITLIAIGQLLLDEAFNAALAQNFPNMADADNNNTPQAQVPTFFVPKVEYQTFSAKNSTLRWRNLRIAAVSVSILTVMVITILASIYWYKKSVDTTLFSFKYPVKPKEAPFLEHQTKDKPISVLREYYKQFVGNDANFDLVDPRTAPPEQVQIFQYSTTVTDSFSIQYLTTDSYLELVKRISNKLGRIVVLMPYSVRDGSVYFSSAIGPISLAGDIMAVPVDFLSDEQSLVALKRLTGPF